MADMFRRNCQIHSFSFSVSTGCKDLEPVLSLLYPALPAASGKCHASWSIERTRGKKAGSPGYLVFEEGTPVHESRAVDDALDVLEWRITARILQNLLQFVQLHAAGLVAGGKALVLMGPSGAGKSSLALSLLSRGWKCLSDEVVLLDPASGALSPFPRSFHVDFKTMELFPELLINQQGTAYLDSKGKMRINPSCTFGDWVAEPSSPGWIVFPSYRPGVKAGIEPLGETEAFTLMMNQAINLLNHGKRGLDALTGLVHDCDCYRLTAGDFFAATGLLAELTGVNGKRSAGPSRRVEAALHSGARENNIRR